MDWNSFKPRKSMYSIAVLAIIGGVSFRWFDHVFTTWRVVLDLPGDVQVFLEILSMFGHGVGCLVAAMLIWNLDRQGRRGIVLVIGSTLLAGIVSSVLKVIVQRPRPFFERIANESLSHEIDQSVFNNAMQSVPSGHTASAFALGVALAVLYPQGKKMFYGLAMIVGVQRVMTQNHFPSDVCAGAIVGILSANLMLLAYDRFKSRREASASVLPIIPAEEDRKRCA